MRIISGIYKGRILKSPDSYKVRPTADRAKESLFNILNNRFDFDEMKIADLFCGSGSLGLECISRGASECCFVDKDVKLVTKNVEFLNAGAQSKIIRSDVLEFLKNEENTFFDIIFCDPPYDYDRYPELLEKIFLMKTVLILEHSEKFEYDEKFNQYIFLKKKIGTVNFTFYDFC